MYALAASAAGVGVLALGASAEAEIVYTHEVHVVGPNQTYQFSPDRHLTSVFELKNSYTCSDVCLGALFAQPLGPKDGVVGALCQGVFVEKECVYPLRAGAVIGPKQPFSGTLLWSIGSGNGKWHNVKSAYLGLKFRIDGKVHYGWARLNLSPDRFTMTLDGYAYETVAGKPVKAGDKGDAVSALPATLGSLALGRAK
jgi:hypothetical protein